MIQVQFKNLEPSVLARDTAVENLSRVIAQVPETAQSTVQVTLEMKDSNREPGPSLFHVQVIFQGGKQNGMAFQQSAKSLYVALADLTDKILKTLKKERDS
jgi:hypothetical protein